MSIEQVKGAYYLHLTASAYVGLWLMSKCEPALRLAISRNEIFAFVDCFRLLNVKLRLHRRFLSRPTRCFLSR